MWGSRPGWSKGLVSVRVRVRVRSLRSTFESTDATICIYARHALTAGKLRACARCWRLEHEAERGQGQHEGDHVSRAWHRGLVDRVIARAGVAPAWRRSDHRIEKTLCVTVLKRVHR